MKKKFLELWETDTNWRTYVTKIYWGIKNGWLVAKAGKTMISGEFAFNQYSKYGIPPEMTETIINDYLNG